MMHAIQLPQSTRKLAATAVGLFSFALLTALLPSPHANSQRAAATSNQQPTTADPITASTGVNATTSLHLDPGNATATKEMLWRVRQVDELEPWQKTHPYLYTAPGFSAWLRRPVVLFDEDGKPVSPSLGADVVYNLSDPTPLVRGDKIPVLPHSPDNVSNYLGNQTELQAPAHGQKIRPRAHQHAINTALNTPPPSADEQSMSISVYQAMIERKKNAIRRVLFSVHAACNNTPSSEPLSDEPKSK